MIELSVKNQHDKQAVLNAMTELPCVVTVKTGRRRSLEQNAYLWGVCYKTILDQSGETLAGWRNTDLHEYFLGEHFGWEKLSGFGRTRVKPRHRSSTLSKMEFVDYVAFIQEFAANLGIVIADPDED